MISEMVFDRVVRLLSKTQRREFIPLINILLSHSKTVAFYCKVYPASGRMPEINDAVGLWCAASMKHITVKRHDPRAALIGIGTLPKQSSPSSRRPMTALPELV